jgi:hypothetical protein
VLAYRCLQTQRFSTLSHARAKRTEAVFPRPDSLSWASHCSAAQAIFHRLNQLLLLLWFYSPLLDLGCFFSFLIHIQSVGLLGRGISPSQGRYLHIDIYASSGTPTHDPNVRADEDSSCLRPRGHCDRHPLGVLLYIKVISDTFR